MGTSIFIAKIFGILYIIIGVGLIANIDYYRKMMSDFSKNSLMLFYGAMMALAIGVVIVLVHNRWVANWTVIITIIGWAGILKGIWLFVFPNTVAGFMQFYEKNRNLLLVHSLVALTLGIVLTILGFSAK